MTVSSTSAAPRMFGCGTALVTPFGADDKVEERALRELVEHVRPHARIEVATTLGAVVGTHAGPGTVGFFWYAEETQVPGT